MTHSKIAVTVPGGCWFKSAATTALPLSAVTKATQPTLELIKIRAKIQPLLRKAWLFSAISAGTVFFWDPANATQIFSNQRVIIPDEIFIFDVITEDNVSTIFNPGFTNSGAVTPTNPNNPGATRTDSNPLLTSQPYTFTGYKILDIIGKRYENGLYTGDIQYRKSGGTNAEDVGVFNYNYPTHPTPSVLYPTDLIAHAKPDDLWNPGNRGLGFSSTPSLPSQALDNYVSFGGFGFDVFENGVFDEPYQLFTVSSQPTSGDFTTLIPGDYAGCPGSCVGAKIDAVPAPLPILGIGAALTASRRLRKIYRQA